MAKIRLWRLIGLFTVLNALLFGCALPENDGIELAINSQSLIDADDFQVFVGPLQQNGKTVTCNDYLTKKISFDSKKFKTEKRAPLIMGDSTRSQTTIDNLTPGTKIFIVAGYKSDKLVLLGCDTGTIEKGKKLVISIILLPM